MLTSFWGFDIIVKSLRDSSDGSRKCRNWQTSKTKDLVMLTSCGFKSHLPHWLKRKCLRLTAWGIFLFTHWGESLSPSGFPDSCIATARTRNMLRMFRRKSLSSAGNEKTLLSALLKVSFSIGNWFHSPSGFPDSCRHNKTVISEQLAGRFLMERLAYLYRKGGNLRALQYWLVILLW